MIHVSSRCSHVFFSNVLKKVAANTSKWLNGIRGSQDIKHHHVNSYLQPRYVYNHALGNLSNSKGSVKKKSFYFFYKEWKLLNLGEVKFVGPRCSFAYSLHLAFYFWNFYEGVHWKYVNAHTPTFFYTTTKFYSHREIKMEHNFFFIVGFLINYLSMHITFFVLLYCPKARLPFSNMSHMKQVATSTPHSIPNGQMEIVQNVFFLPHSISRFTP